MAMLALLASARIAPIKLGRQARLCPRIQLQLGNGAISLARSSGSSTRMPPYGSESSPGRAFPHARPRPAYLGYQTCDILHLAATKVSGDRPPSVDPESHQRSSGKMMPLGQGI